MYSTIRALLAFGLFTVSSLAAAAADVSPLYRKIADIQSEISANSDTYSDANVSSILTELESALQSAQSPSGGGGDPQCQSAACNYNLRGAQIAEVFRSSTAYSSNCIAHHARHRS